MATNSKIEWTESTWNPITGCTKFSLGCQNCYAERMAKRLYAMGHKNYRNCFAPTFHAHMLSKPLSWKKSRMIFVNSMSDTFHENIDDKYILDIFKIMNTARWHTFQVLTKRTERLKNIAKHVNWTPNIWLGVTIESNEYINRIEDLINCEASTKYISFEPTQRIIHLFPS